MAPGKVGRPLREATSTRQCDILTRSSARRDFGICSLDGILKDLNCLVDLCALHSERRNESNSFPVTRRQHQEAPFERLAGNGCREPSAREGGVEFDGNHQARPTDVGDWLGAHGLQALHELLAALAYVCQHALLFEHFKSRQRGSASHDVSAIGAADTSHLLFGGELRPGGDHGQGVTGRDALRGHQDVWLDPKMLHGPPLPGPAGATLHLIGDQQNVVCTAPLSQAPHESCRWHDITTLAEDWLDNHGRDL
mmetsp:Transcript_14262/g.40554  ORF Transcript_14262/g.40554 Transcript_14262/m.40554 type:complete len:253 (+) Transcript_14262:406-1164(+)